MVYARARVRLLFLRAVLQHRVNRSSYTITNMIAMARSPDERIAAEDAVAVSLPVEEVLDATAIMCKSLEQSEKKSQECVVWYPKSS